VGMRQSHWSSVRSKSPLVESFLWGSPHIRPRQAYTGSRPPRYTRPCYEMQLRIVSPSPAAWKNREECPNGCCQCYHSTMTALGNSKGLIRESRVNAARTTASTQSHSLLDISLLRIDALQHTLPWPVSTASHEGQLSRRTSSSSYSTSSM
jgi:hypothetical protein